MLAEENGELTWVVVGGTGVGESHGPEDPYATVSFQRRGSLLIL